MSTKTHTIKLHREFFDDVESGAKPFELRFDDRGYCVGDHLLLKEWDPSHLVGGGRYTGREVLKIVTYKLRGGSMGLESGYCILGIANDPT